MDVDSTEFGTFCVNVQSIQFNLELVISTAGWPLPICDDLTVVIRFFPESLSFPQFPPYTDNGRASLVIAFSIAFL